MAEPVTLDVSDGVATVTIDRPEARNALSVETADAITDVFDDVADSDARCVLVRGAGEAFCAGGDIGAMRDAIESDASPAERARLVETVNRAMRRVYGCPLPTVAAVDGAAVGAGAGLAVACDLQVASPDAVFGFGFRRVGLSLDSGVSYLLARLVGRNTAKRLVYTGELVDADRARDLGLVTHLFGEDEYESSLADLVATVAEGATVALRASKRLLNREAGSYAAATDREATAQELAFGTRDHEEAVDAFLSDRTPEFEGR